MNKYRTWTSEKVIIFHIIIHIDVANVVIIITFSNSIYRILITRTLANTHTRRGKNEAAWEYQIESAMLLIFSLFLIYLLLHFSVAGYFLLFFSTTLHRKIIVFAFVFSDFQMWNDVHATNETKTTTTAQKKLTRGEEERKKTLGRFERWGEQKPNRKINQQQEQHNISPLKHWKLINLFSVIRSTWPKYT